jgi:dolichyl-diphosphooligosaccharide--protein glycosyltransferase/undecaprenyl-diphosphooligosaccharide--protein glycosyltransferase
MLQNENQKTFFYILLAFTFSVLVHLFWVYQFYGYEPFMWNGEFMINTNDGYYWAEGARDLIAGFHQNYDHSPIDSAPAILTAFFYKILPFSFETIIFYMSVFLSSLVVIPIILIAKNLKNMEMGFVAALLASIAWSYYNRTLAGYYDTDMLNIVFPMFLLWSLILALQTKEEKYLLFTALEIIAYRAWYPQSYSLEFAFFGLLVAYILYKKYKNKEEIQYELTLITFMLFAMVYIHPLIRLVVVIALYIAQKKKVLEFQYLVYLFWIAVGVFLISGGVNPIIGQLKGYVFRDAVEASNDELQLYFFSVMQTVREAGKIPFETFANRISGHSITFLLSVVGYLLLLWRHRVMLLSLPLVGLGFLAYSGGLRFTIYAVPVLAFGISYLLFEVAKYFQVKLFKFLFLSAGVVLILLPNIWHAWQYRVPTVFEKSEVEVLDKLKKIAQREDYVLSWWDYGYPIRYYSDVKTLIDGGKHSGAVNFPVSYALTHDQLQAAKLARLDVEFTEKKEKAKKEELYEKDSAELKRSVMADIILSYGYNDANTFFEALSLDAIMPKEKTRDIYVYLPKRLISIFPTVAKFSNIDIMTGEENRKPMFLPTRPVSKQGSVIKLQYGRYMFSFDLSKASITLGGKAVPVGNFIVTRYDKNKKLQKIEQSLNIMSNISIIYMENYNTMLVMDNEMYNSTFVQLFVLENYDPALFEPVILSPVAKVYKLKL